MLYIQHVIIHTCVYLCTYVHTPFQLSAPRCPWSVLPWSWKLPAVPWPNRAKARNIDRLSPWNGTDSNIKKKPKKNGSLMFTVPFLCQNFWSYFGQIPWKLGFTYKIDSYLQFSYLQNRHWIGCDPPVGRTIVPMDKPCEDVRLYGAFS